MPLTTGFLQNPALSEKATSKIIINGIDGINAAATVKEFVNGRGTEIGGGDGLGTIILPRPLPEPVINEVLEWPSE